MSNLEHPRIAEVGRLLAENDRLRKELDDLKLTFEDKTDSNARRVWKKMTDMALRQRDEAKAEIDRLRATLQTAEYQTQRYKDALDKNASFEQLWEEVSTENDRLRDALTTVVVVYKRDNPLRTADQHSPSCTCMRCAVDAADAALAKEGQ